ncbi:MAG: hypothetical protein ACJAXW_000991 [Candidatus Azotimanducaceae bacterium]|jgi:hypothetical protein
MNGGSGRDFCAIPTGDWFIQLHGSRATPLQFFYVAEILHMLYGGNTFQAEFYFARGTKTETTLKVEKWQDVWKIELR